MDIAITLLSIIHVLISLLLLFIVMMQRPKQEGLGAAFGGDMTSQMFGAQTTNVLQKGTVFLAIIFFLNSILIAGLLARQSSLAQESRLMDVPEAVVPGDAGNGAEVPVPAPGLGEVPMEQPEAGEIEEALELEEEVEVEEVEEEGEMEAGIEEAGEGEEADESEGP